MHRWLFGQGVSKQADNQTILLILLLGCLCHNHRHDLWQVSLHHHHSPAIIAIYASKLQISVIVVVVELEQGVHTCSFRHQTYTHTNRRVPTQISQNTDLVHSVSFVWAHFDFSQRTNQNTSHHDWKSFVFDSCFPVRFVLDDFLLCPLHFLNQTFLSFVCLLNVCFLSTQHSSPTSSWKTCWANKENVRRRRKENWKSLRKWNESKKRKEWMKAREQIELFAMNQLKIYPKYGPSNERLIVWNHY